MANEITLATLTSNGGRIAKLLGANVHTNLFDSQIGLRSLLTYYALSGPSATLATTKLTMGYAAAAASGRADSARQVRARQEQQRRRESEGAGSATGV